MKIREETMKEIKSEGKTISEAIDKALKELNLTRDQVEVEIIQEEKKGILGIGSKNACVIVREKKWTGKNENSTDKTKENKQENQKGEKIHSPEVFSLNSYNIKLKFTDNILEDGKNLFSQIMNFSGINFNIVDSKYDNSKKILYINFSTQDSGLFLYDDAKFLISLQHIISSILNKNRNEKIVVKLDTADFWNKTENRLKRDIDKAISFIKKTGKPYRLRPMPSQFRKYIHDIVKEKYPGFSTVSEGENKWRKVVIHPNKNRNLVSEKNVEKK